MEYHFGTRVTSLALATAVTLLLLGGLDALAISQHSGGMQMSQACGPAPVAAAKPAAALLPG